MLAAALDGIERGLEAPKALNNINLYHLDAKERRKLGVKELPGSLAEALNELEKDTVLTSALGDVTCEAFMRAKWEEWDEFVVRRRYLAHVILSSSCVILSEAKNLLFPQGKLREGSRMLKVRDFPRHRTTGE